MFAMYSNGKIELRTSESDPAGGRSEITTYARLGSKEAENLVSQIEQFLPDVREIERKEVGNKLNSAKQALATKQQEVKSLTARVRELEKSSK